MRDIGSQYFAANVETLEMSDGARGNVSFRFCQNMAELVVELACAEELAGRRQGVELAAGSGRTNLRGDANLLAQRSRARRIVEAARRGADRVTRRHIDISVAPLRGCAVHSSHGA